MHKMLLVRNTSRDTVAMTVFSHSITDSKREREGRLLLVYIKRSFYIILCVVNMNC